MNRKIASGMMLTLLLSISVLVSSVVAAPTITLGIGVYWDSSLMNQATSIDWGILEHGSWRDVIVYVRNEGNVPITLSMGSSNWNPPEATGFVSLNWNYTGEVLEPSIVVPVTPSLFVSSTMEGIYAFSFDWILSAAYGDLTASVLIATYGSIARTWIVDDDGPADFHTIQEAINAANPEDTILVRAGTYYENVIVNKTVSLVGENRDDTIIDGNNAGSIVEVASDDVRVSSLTLRNGVCGVYVRSRQSATIFDNIIRGHGCGVFLWASNCTVSGNNITNNNWWGIDITNACYSSISGNCITNNGLGILGNGGSRGNTISGNSITNNDGSGIQFADGIYNNNISGNTIAGNNGIGIRLVYYCGNQSICGNNITHNNSGIYLHMSRNTTISGNNITANGPYGIGLVAGDSDTSSNTIFGNTLAGHNYGIYLQGAQPFGRAHSNTIFGNSITDSYFGIEFSDASDNTFLHNSFIGNTQQVHDVSRENPEVTPSVNIWDDGYPSGGNYWGDYAGADVNWGPYQNQTGSDGIGDMPHTIDVDNRDSYPLMSPHEYWSNPISGDINKDMTVNSRDLSQIAAAYGSTTEKPNWNPSCDINRDDKIDVLELFTLGKNYGETARTYIFSDGFETNDFSSWTATVVDGDGTIDTSDLQKHQGTYSAVSKVKTGTSYACTRLDLPAQTTLYARSYVCFGNLPFPVADRSVFFLSFAGAGGGIASAGLRHAPYPSTDFVWRINYYGAGAYHYRYSDPVTPQTGRWYCLELKVVIHASQGEVRLYVDGDEVIAQTGIKTDDRGNILRFFSGITDTVGTLSDTMTVYTDCVILSDTYVGVD